MALDSELSALRGVLSKVLVDIDNLRPTIKHLHQLRTQSSSTPDRQAKGGSQLTENTIKELTSCHRRIGELVNALDPGGDSHRATSFGDLGGSPDAAAAERNAAAVGSDLSAELANEPSLTLGRHQMGRELVRSLKELCGSNGGVRGKITCTGIPRVDLASLRLRISMPMKERGVVFAVRYARSGDMVTLFDANVSQFHCPMSSGLIQKPADNDVKQFIDGILSYPPAATFAYYVGDALTSEFDDILETDDGLRQLREAGAEIKGVNTTYWLLGAAGSGTAAHCEDLNLRSCNITLEGYKWWVVVNESSTRAFEEWAKGLDRLVSEPEKDEQWVRRMNLVPNTARLVENGIGFSEYVTGPGEMITTAPRQYHWVVNVTDGLSLAINFAFDDELQQGLKTLPTNELSPKWGLRQKLDLLHNGGGSAREATSPPAPPRHSQTDSNAGEHNSGDESNAGGPIDQNNGNTREIANQSDGNARESNHKDLGDAGEPVNQDNDNPRRNPSRVVRQREDLPPANPSLTPAKRRRVWKHGRSDGTREQRQAHARRQFLDASNEFDPYCDVVWDLPLTEDEDICKVLLTLRGRCAAENCFKILRAWKAGDSHPKKLISDFLQSKSPQRPGGSVGALLEKSTDYTLLHDLLASWAQVYVFTTLQKAFGHVRRFDQYHFDQMPGLLGIPGAKLNSHKVRSWYNFGERLSQISPDSLEGLAIYCLLPLHNRQKDHAHLATKATLAGITDQERLSQFSTFYNEHDYTLRLIRVAVRLISMITTNKPVTYDEDYDGKEVNDFAIAIENHERDVVLKLLGATGQDCM